MFVALNEKHMHFYSHMTVDQSNSWPQMSAYSIQPKVFFQAYHNVSVKKPEVFEKMPEVSVRRPFFKNAGHSAQRPFKKTKA